MAGPAQDVIISKAALNNRPQPWVLTTPESAVRSYLDWVAYAYRVAESSVATPTMGSNLAVKVDSYIQYNLQSGRLIDQTLKSIAFGTPTTEATHTLLPARESWTYRYVSIKEVGKTLSGPFPANYDDVYTVVKTKNGWVVDSVQVKPLDTIK